MRRVVSIRAVIVDPSAPEALRVTSVAQPEAGPSEVLIDVHHVSLNHGDLNDARSGRVPAGAVLGSDAAGVVAQAAADGGPSVGTRVVTLTSRAFAERAAVNVSALAEVPSSVDLAEVATLPVAGLGALRALRAAGPVRLSGAAGSSRNPEVSWAGSASPRPTDVLACRRAILRGLMSNDNVELVRSFYRAASVSRFIDLLDEEVVFDFSAYPVPGPAVLRGKEAAIDWCRSYWGTWDEYILEPSAIIDASEDQVVVVQHERARGNGSGVRLERHWAVIFTIRTGRVVRFEAFRTSEEALAAAGLRA